MGYSLTPSGGGIGLVDYSLVPIVELDVLYVVFAFLSLIHAVNEKSKMLWISALVGGLVCEQACIRGGGTHCHHSGLVDVSICSSGNSVLFYGPWVYSAVKGARRMGSSGILSQAMWTGLLTGLICWPYEMQGPLAQMWKWPAEDGLVMPKSAMGNFQSAANDPKRGYVTNPHALPDLATKAFGFPIHAPYFDMAYGVGIGASMALLPMMPAVFHTVLLGPLLAVVYIRLPIFIADMFQVSVLLTDPCVMAFTAVLALSTANGLSRRVDWLLVAGPLMSQIYWGAMPFRGYVPFPAELKVIICFITIAGLWIWIQMGASKSVGEVIASKKSDSKKTK